jgi:hypothetical protein
MHKTIAIAAMLAALSFSPVMAADTSTETKMEPTASGAASDQAPGSETSDRTPDKATPTPDTQVDKSKQGETSDRTPEHHGETK